MTRGKHWEWQECIPVGCLSSAAVAVSHGGRGLLPGGLLPGGVVSQHALRQTPLPVDRHTPVKTKSNLRNFVADGNKGTTTALHKAYWFPCCHFSDISGCEANSAHAAKATTWADWDVRRLYIVIFEMVPGIRARPSITCMNLPNETKRKRYFFLRTIMLFWIPDEEMKRIITVRYKIVIKEL